MYVCVSSPNLDPALLCELCEHDDGPDVVLDDGLPEAGHLVGEGGLHGDELLVEPGKHDPRRVDVPMEAKQSLFKYFFNTFPICSLPKLTIN